MLIIPAIDLKGGECVRLRQGRMEDATVFSSNPVDMARQWVERGARRLHLVDLDGAFAGEPVNGHVVRAIAHEFPDLPMQIGGGVRDIQTFESYLEAGVQYVIIGTAAVKNPALVSEACRHFRGHVIVGLDAKQGMVATDGWAEVTEVRAVDLAQQFAHEGVSAFVYTDIDRDGMMQGLNVEETLKMARASHVPVIASGGITNLDDIRALKETHERGIIGAIAGRAIYEGTLDLQEAQHLCDQP